MESKIAAMEVEVENLKIWSVKHELDNGRNHKYMTHMMEDLIARLSGIERSAARFEADLAHRNGSDLSTQQTLKEIFQRIRALERLAYIAIGGLLSIGGIATFFGWNILKLLGK